MSEIQWTLSTGRKSIAVERGDESIQFEYDVVEMKLLAEELELRHGMRKTDSNKVDGPTVQFLREYASALSQLGIEGCTVDAAFRFYNLIGTQFVLMTAHLDQQIEALVKG